MPKSFLFFQKIEPWESEKEEADWEKYFWDLSSSKTTTVDLVKRMKELSQVWNKLFLCETRFPPVLGYSLTL
jgi:hypothetical protein